MNILKFLAVLTVTVFTLSSVVLLTGCNKSDSAITLKVWNYYSGVQATSFNALVDEFNDTVGRNKGIIVDSISQSSINTLADELIKAVNNDVLGQEVPDIASIYPETAFILNQKNAIVPLNDYFSESELETFIPSFLEAGKLRDGGEVYGCPIFKSTEILTYNSTDWAEFETFSGIGIDDIVTAEDMAAAAESYYNWTDAKTPAILEDGKALYGRDSLANYLYNGAVRLGHTFFTVNSSGELVVDLDKNTFKKLWDNYYIPYINGYYCAIDKFRSGDMKVGRILAFTGSSSSVDYISSTVTDVNEDKHDIDLVFKKPLGIENQAKEVYVQQGASFYMLKSNKAKQQASATFLKWFTADKQNLDFSLNVGYSPVKKATNVATVIEDAMNKKQEPSQKILDALKISADVFNNHETYVSPAFEQAKDIRSYLEDSFKLKLTTDRKAVTDAIAGGATRADAVANFTTSTYFDTWYNTIESEITDMINE